MKHKVLTLIIDCLQSIPQIIFQIIITHHRAEQGSNFPLAFLAFPHTWFIPLLCEKPMQWDSLCINFINPVFCSFASSFITGVTALWGWYHCKYGRLALHRLPSFSVPFNKTNYEIASKPVQKSDWSKWFWRKE